MQKFKVVGNFKTKIHNVDYTIYTLINEEGKGISLRKEILLNMLHRGQLTLSNATLTSSGSIRVTGDKPKYAFPVQQCMMMYQNLGTDKEYKGLIYSVSKRNTVTCTDSVPRFAEQMPKVMEIANGTNYFDQDIFRYRDELEKIILPSTLVKIPPNAFAGSGLQQVDIPDSVLELGEQAFASNTKLTRVKLSQNLLYIGSGCFSQCRNLKTLEMPQTMLGIEADAFISCHHLESIRIPKGVKIIYESTFSGCGALRQVSLPDTLEYIGTGAFFRCLRLADIDFPKTLGSIGVRAFAHCPIKSAKIPSVTTLLNEAFNSCTELQDVTLSDDLSVINRFTFSKCTSLQSIKLPKNLERIESYAFQECHSLEYIKLPEKLKTIKCYAFRNAGLVSIKIPQSVEDLGDGAFKHCYKLRQILIPRHLYQKIHRYGIANYLCLDPHTDIRQY